MTIHIYENGMAIAKSYTDESRTLFIGVCNGVIRFGVQEP